MPCSMSAQGIWARKFSIVGEARTEHKRQLLYSSLEVDCEFRWLQNLAEYIL